MSNISCFKLSERLQFWDHVTMLFKDSAMFYNSLWIFSLVNVIKMIFNIGLRKSLNDSWTLWDSLSYFLQIVMMIVVKNIVSCWFSSGELMFSWKFINKFKISEKCFDVITYSMLISNDLRTRLEKLAIKSSSIFIFIKLS